jgi:hypothetical protein
MATKKVSIVLFVFLIGSISLYAQVSSKVDAALAQFAREYPQYAGKAYPTSNDRSWQEQMQIILDRPGSYKNIQGRFTEKYGLTFPVKRSDLTNDMLNWWEREIMAQAGLPNGFAHVGGKAVDVSVKNVDSRGTQLLAGILEKNGLRILYEQGNRYEHSYFVGTLLLHCY